MVFGAAVGCLGLSRKRAARLFMYLTLRDTLSAATRLNLVGPLEAAAALRRCAAVAEKLSSEAAAAAEVAAASAQSAQSARSARSAQSVSAQHETAAVTALNPAVVAVVRRAAATSPLVDILQGGHDSLYSRLFSS